jgi:hypothetical protein
MPALVVVDDGEQVDEDAISELLMDVLYTLG